MAAEFDEEMFKTTLMGGFDKEDVLTKFQEARDEAYKEQKKLEAENTESVDIVRGLSISLDELPVLLQAIRSGAPMGQSVPKNAPKPDEEEVSE